MSVSVDPWWVFVSPFAAYDRRSNKLVVLSNSLVIERNRFRTQNRAIETPASHQ